MQLLLACFSASNDSQQWIFFFFKRCGPHDVPEMKLQNIQNLHADKLNLATHAQIAVSVFYDRKHIIKIAFSTIYYSMTFSSAM